MAIRYQTDLNSFALRLDHASWRLLLGLLLLVVWTAPTLALPPARQYYIYDFATTGKFSPTRITHLKEVDWIRAYPDGRLKVEHRYETIQTRLSHQGVFGNDPRSNKTYSYVAELQKASLDEMLASGYIPRKLYDDVIEGIGIWDPAQIRYIAEWSEVSVGELKELFHNEIPLDRIIGSLERDVSDPKRKVKFLRSGVMLVLGQKVDAERGVLVPLKLPWQDFPTNKENPISQIDRGKFPFFLAEISRAYSTTGPLGGSFTDPLKIAFHILRIEAMLFGVPEDSSLIFCESFGTIHTEIFRRNFHMREWTQELKSELEREPRKAFETFSESPRFRHSAPTTILATTLANVLEHRSIEDISEVAYKISMATKNEMSIANANLFSIQVQALRYGYLKSAYPEQITPIIIGKPTEVVLSEVAVAVATRGVTTQEHFPKIQAAVGRLDFNLFSFTQFAEEPGLIVPSKKWAVPWGVDTQGEPVHNFRYFSVENLSENAAVAHPMEYLASVVLSSHEYILSQIFLAPPLAQINLRHVIHRARPELCADWNDPYRMVDPNILLEIFPMVLATASPLIAAQLRHLEGKEEATQMISFPMLQQITSPMTQTRPAYLFSYSLEGLKRLRERFPNLVTTPTCADEITRALLFQLAPRL